jgi:hypothetical protein
MAQIKRLLIVNFGSGKASLATVGYALYNRNGSLKQANTTTGVSEVGTATGIYAIDASIDEAFDGIVLWTTGEASPRYASVETLGQLNSIQNETDNIRLIWNSLRNQGTFYAKLIDKIDGLKNIIDGINNTTAKINAKDILKLEDIKKSILDIRFPEPIVNLPAPVVNIPDYSQELLDLKNTIQFIRGELMKVPKIHKEYTPNFDNLIILLSNLEQKMNNVVNDNSKKITDEIKFIRNAFTRLDSMLIKIKIMQDKIESLDINDKEIINSRKEISEDIKRLNMYIYDFVSSPYIKEAKDNMGILMSFGHKRKVNG